MSGEDTPRTWTLRTVTGGGGWENWVRPHEIIDGGPVEVIEAGPVLDLLERAVAPANASTLAGTANEIRAVLRSCGRLGDDEA